MSTRNWYVFNLIIFFFFFFGKTMEVFLSSYELNVLEISCCFN